MHQPHRLNNPASAADRLTLTGETTPAAQRAACERLGIRYYKRPHVDECTIFLDDKTHDLLLTTETRMLDEAENGMVIDANWTDDQGLQPRSAYADDAVAEIYGYRIDQERKARRELRSASLGECLDIVDVYDVIDAIKADHPAAYAMILEKARFLAIDAEVAMIRGGA